MGVSSMGGQLPGLTPNVDGLAARGVRFFTAHVNSGICVPSRGAIATGRYGFSSGVYGFRRAHEDVPLLMELLREHGYITGILGKVDHSSVKASYRWDYTRDYGDLGSGRSPTRYEECSTEFFRQSAAARKPFYLMVNSHDPHRPFQEPGTLLPGAEAPSKWYRSEEIPVPGFLPDLPGVRTELASYYNSVRRLDDTFGKVMAAVRAAGIEDKTVVIFLSDNGSATPFGKANSYVASTHTPLIIAWPGVSNPGLMDRKHFVSGIDLFPTLFAGLGLPAPAGLSGRSFLPLLRGESQSGRDSVFTQIDYMVNGPARPMRGVQDHDYAYIFNPWSDQATAYRNNNEGQIMKAMVDAALTQSSVAARVQLFRFRAVEEFYDLKNDPDSLHNLNESPAHAAAVQKYREKLRALMVTHGDPLLATFDAREDPIRMKAAMDDCYLTALPPGKPGEVSGVKN